MQSRCAIGLAYTILIAWMTPHLASAQQQCMSQQQCTACSDTTILSPFTTVSDVLMSCTIPSSLVLNSSSTAVWEWEKLAADSTIETFLSNESAIFAVGHSVYNLSVECGISGLYEVLYKNGNDGSCVYSCQFLIEVVEVRGDVLREEFSAYPNQTAEMSIPSEPSDSSTSINRVEGSMQVSVGTCSSKFYLASGCIILDVTGTWFKDGSTLRPHGSPLYKVSSSGELRIPELTNETAGYYVCVTHIGEDNLGSFRTVDINIVLLVPRPPVTTVTTEPSATTSTTTEDPDTTRQRSLIFGTLQAWEGGLILVNIGVVLLLIVIMIFVAACFVSRRRKQNKHRGRAGYSSISLTPRRAKSPTSDAYGRRRPPSMVEQIQMMEETEIEAVDYAGPCEIPFSSILFEELLHKGTFKVVHHATVNFPAQGMMSVPVAVKRLKDENSELGSEELMSEMYTLKAIHDKAGSHPNLVSLLGLTTQGGPTCLLLEYVPYGTLDDFLFTLKEGPIPEWYLRFVRDTLRGAYHKHVSGDLMSVIVQVAEGMKFLTDFGFIHRDLSTRNILIGDRLNIKIANPGVYYEGYYYVVTEREHFLQDMAPECLWEKCYSVWSDVWSFGMLAYKVVTLESEPYPNTNINELYDRMSGGERPQLLASFSNELYFLLQRCWQFVAVERPSFESIINDLHDMAEKPTRHILVKATKDPSQPGYVSENGQVFLRTAPQYALDGPLLTAQKKGRRNSGTQRSLVSSIDDTVYTRETAETTVELTQSDNDLYNNYEDYLKGDLNHTDEQANKQWVETEGGNVLLLPEDEEKLRKKKKRLSKGSDGSQQNLNSNSNNMGSVSVPNDTVQMKLLRRLSVGGSGDVWESDDVEGGEEEEGVSSNGTPSVTDIDDHIESSDEVVDSSREKLVRL